MYFIAIIIDSNLNVFTLLRIVKNLYLVPGFLRFLTCEVNKSILLFAADIFNPIPRIVKLWGSQTDMSLHFLMGADLMK